MSLMWVFFIVFVDHIYIILVLPVICPAGLQGRKIQFAPCIKSKW